MLRQAVSASLVLASVMMIAPADAQEPPVADQEPTTPRPGQFVQRSQSPASASSAVDFQTPEPFSATYAGAEIAIVAHEMLGEFLGVDYSLAPDVSGQVTLRVENLRSRLTTIDALRSALAPLGIAVMDRGDFVAIARATDQTTGPVAAAVLDPGEPGPAGGGLAIITPRYIAPSRLGPLIAPFAPSASVLSSDDSRRFVLVQGDEASLTAMSAAAAMFDVDWFSQISTGTFDLRHVSPQDIIGELRLLLGPSATLAEFVPLPRLSQLVVLARSPELLRTIGPHVERLDRPGAVESPGLIVYRARHVGVEQLAESLREGAGESSSPITAPAQAAPSPLAGGGDAPPQPALAAQARAFTVSVNAMQNLVIVRGDAGQLAEARILLEAMDQPPAQVLIEAAIVEVTLNDELQYGVNWSGVEDRLTLTFSDVESGDVARRFPGFAASYVNTDIEAAINLLASITRVEVVSRPSILALNNETAELQVGDQVPIVTQSAVSVTDPGAPIVNQTTYRDTGVILSVSPSVRSGGMVEIKVAQEVSQVARTTSSGIDSPTIQQRRMESTLLVPSGQSVALGGLISSQRTNSVTGVPILKDIPLLGQLFRSNSTRVDRTELLVFLTPRVLADGRASVEATDQLRQSFLKLEQELAPR